MKNRKEKKNRISAIPTDSFSDIAFLLIVYFMVATTLLKVKSITADLPSGEKSAAAAQSEKTPIVNLRGAEIFFNDKAVNMEDLNARLAALTLAQKEGGQRVIMLESARGTPYENYFKALAAISSNGGVVAIVEAEEK